MIDSFLEQQFDGNSGIDEMSLYHLKTGGKRLRGRLAIESSKDIGIEEDKALLWAAACELLHNATLIHDDIQDNDPIRRGQPSLWKKFGVPQAINVGDFFIFKAFRLASQLGSTHITLLLAQASETLVKGQSEELRFTTTMNQYWDTYLRVARLKTGILFQLPIEGIHLLRHGRLVNSYDYAREWSQLGVVYQIFDDINDFLGLKQKGQKQKDLVEKRINAVIAHLSKDRMCHSIIKTYSDCKIESKDQKEIINQINGMALEYNTLDQLRSFTNKLLSEFQQSSQTHAKSLILNEMSKSLNKGQPRDENISI